MALLFGSVAGILLMLTVTGILSPVAIVSIGIGGILGGCLIAPQLSGKAWLKK